MTNATPLEKRIKRRITGREHTFFVVVSPGLADVCITEMKTLFPDKELSVIDGGIEFKGSVRDCYKANLHLRTASRILMRIGSLTATSFSMLEKKLSDFPWELYLTPGFPTEIHVTSKKSKLIHSDAIAERFAKDIAGKIPENTKERTVQKIFIRVVNDRFVISADSTGELLYRRGIKTGGGKAPVRETIAAGALLLSGYNGSRPLIDPMCGSGTFSVEAAMIAQKIPPGWYRDFAFMAWPCFRPGTWKDLRRNAEKNIIDREEKSIFASDLEQQACDTLKKSIEKTRFSKLIDIQQSDFFDIQPETLSDNKGLVIINPPYGLRLGNVKDCELLMDKIISQFESGFKGWHIAVISPFTSFIKKSSLKFKKHPVTHGGLKLFLAVGR